MSSPFARPSSSQRSTPVRQANGFHRSHRQSQNSSPSRQQLEQFSRLVIDDDKAFSKSLDEQTAGRQQLHIDALDRALAKHEQVRQSAELARERAELEIERERRRRQDEEEKAVERARRTLEEQRLAEERRRLDEAKASEERRRKAEALKREEEEERYSAEESKRREAEELARRKAGREKEEIDRKARADAEAKQRAQQTELSQARSNTLPQQSNGIPANGSLPNGFLGTASQAQNVPAQAQSGQHLPPGIQSELVSNVNALEATHQKYLDLHQRLKKMRNEIETQYKQMAHLKTQVGDWRRAIKKCVGQVSKGQLQQTKDANRKTVAEVCTILDTAAHVAEPSINVTQYLVDGQQSSSGQTHGPAVLLYLLNHFAKNIISQIIQESSVDTKSADPLGVLAVTVFARPNYLFNGKSLIDLLWAKYHKACPVLFGINGSETTKTGRLRLGWSFDAADNSFVPAQEHFDRMTGLGAGFAAITLRDFSKSKNTNPAPNRLFWQSFARILNTPKPDVGSTHFVLLKAMTQDFVPRIIGIFGSAGVAIMRTACHDFPDLKGPRNEKGNKLPAVLALESLPFSLQQDNSFTL